MPAFEDALRASLALVLSLLAGTAGAEESQSSADFSEASKRYEVQVAASPEDFDARLGAARSLNRVMAIRTHANLPLVDRLQDTDENRALWADLGERALEHARVASRLRPDSVEAAGELATAYMFYSSSLGILSAILKGAGTEYQEHARRVVELDEQYDDALGHTLLAGFFLVAPWPIRDMDASRAAYERAAQVAPASAGNQYGLGVFWAREGDPERARQHFERTLSMPCSEHTERLFCDWLAGESRRALTTLEEP